MHRIVSAFLALLASTNLTFAANTMWPRDILQMYPELSQEERDAKLRGKEFRVTAWLGHTVSWDVFIYLRTCRTDGDDVCNYNLYCEVSPSVIERLKPDLDNKTHPFVTLTGIYNRSGVGMVWLDQCRIEEVTQYK